MVKIVLLGAGNVAYHLTHNLLNNNTVKLIQVYNRSIEKLDHLKSKILITNNLTNLKEADIYIICVSDDIIPEISSKINFENKLVVHTSGSVSIDELKSNSNKGVFYLLQTFSKDREINFSEIPICIEAKSENDLELLKTLANSISKKVYEIDSSQRKNLHLSAVFVNNFVNHLYFIGNEICDQNNIPFEILHPIIQETTNKLKYLSPFEAQTGPAKRNDKKTIDKHKAMLPLSQQEIYKLLTKSIQKTYGKKL